MELAYNHREDAEREFEAEKETIKWMVNNGSLVVQTAGLMSFTAVVEEENGKRNVIRQFSGAEFRNNSPDESR